MSAKPLATILTEITTNFPDNTSGTITPAIARTTYSDMASSSMDALTINVMNYAGGVAINNGTNDAGPAFTAAFAALSGGGVLYIPAGTYNLVTGVITPNSNTTVQGAGVDATILKCTGSFPNNVTIQIPMTLTGLPWPSAPTTYAINAPTLGATTVTTTSAADAGNFAANNIIFISGPTHGTSFWYPGWYTTVVSVNAGTGVITLAESLPIGGSQLTLVQKIVSLPTNIGIRDMTIISGSTAAIECQGGRNFLFENLKIIPGAGGVSTATAVFGVHRNSTFRHVMMEQGANPMELFVSTGCTIDDCHIINGYILIDGGCIDCSVVNNTICDPQNNGSSGHGMAVGTSTGDGSTRTRIIGNRVTGIPSSFSGINCADNPDSSRFHLIVGNTLIGANTTNTTGISNGKGVVVGNFLMNLQSGIQMEGASSGADPIVEGNYFDSTVTNRIDPFTSPALYRTRQEPRVQAMPAGVVSPQVQGSSTYTLTQGGAQNVTSFNGGVPGDEIVVITKDGNTTFKQGATIQMKGGIDYNAPNNTVMCFVCSASGAPPTYFEKSRSQ